MISAILAALEKGYEVTFFSPTAFKGLGVAVHKMDDYGFTAKRRNYLETPSNRSDLPEGVLLGIIIENLVKEMEGEE